jgi:hypothetical protein
VDERVIHLRQGGGRLHRLFSWHVSEAVAHQTQQWVVEFQSSMAELEKAPNVQMESAQPETLTVTVDNADASEQPIPVDIDSVAYGTMTGTSWGIRQLPLGTHTVLGSGRKGAAQLQGTGSVVVPAGGAARLDLKIA